MLKHVLWDWNGTLLDDIDLAIEVMNRLLASRCLPAIDRDRHRATFGFPVRDYYARLGLGPEHGSFEECARIYIDEYNRLVREIPVKPQARAILERLRARGVVQVMLSASDSVHLRELVEHHQIGALFDELVCLDDHYADGKLGVARAWLARTRCDPAELLVVGDTLHDYEVACGLGARCVLVADGHHDEARLRATGCSVVVSLDELYTADTPLRALLAAQSTRHG